MTIGDAAVASLARRWARVHVAPDKADLSLTLPIKHNLKGLEEDLAQGPSRVFGVRADTQHTVAATVDLELQHVVLGCEDQLYHLPFMSGMPSTSNTMLGSVSRSSQEFTCTSAIRLLTSFSGP